jgi:flagellar hook-basal body complex protein FliE
MTALPAIPMAAQQLAGNSAAAAAGLADPGLGAASAGTAATGPAGASGSYANPFAGVMRDAIQATQQLETNAANAVTGLVSGSGVDVHTAMIAKEKSNLAFEMMLSFRNKAVSAYQQLMGMQF